MITYSLNPTAASASNDGTTVTVNPATIGVGGATNVQAELRFDLSSIVDTDIPVSAVLQCSVISVGAGPNPNLYVWASDFGAAINTATYTGGQVQNNYSGTVGEMRIPVNQPDNLFANGGTVAAAAVLTRYIPLRFIHNTGAGAVCDLEIRAATPTSSAGDVVTIGGPANATTGLKPLLTIITLTPAQLANNNPFRTQAIGAESYLAFAQEPSEGVAVKACVIMDADTIGLTQNAANLKGNGLTKNRVRPHKATYGRTGAGGSCTFDVTPEKCWQLLPGILLKSLTTGGSAPYTHTWIVAPSSSLASYTFVTKKGSFRMVYPGSRISKLTLTLGLDQILRGSIDVQALDEYTYDYTSAGLIDEQIIDANAAYDTVQNGLWSFADAAVSVGGAPGDYVQSFSIEMTNDFQERRGLNGQRGPTSQFPLGFTVDIKFDLYFENEIVLRQFLGDQSNDFPFKAGKNLLFQDVNFNIQKTGSATNITIDTPQVLFETVGDPIQGEGQIMLSVQACATNDDSVNSNVVITHITNEPASNFQPSSNVITVYPVNKTQ